MAEPIPVTDLYVAGRVPVAPSDSNRVAIGATLDFSTAFAYVIDFRVTNQPLVVGNIRSLFLDNSNNPNEVIVNVSITRQEFTVPAEAEGFFIMTCVEGSTITLSGNGGGDVQTSLQLFNYDQAPQVWYKNGLDLTGTLTVQGPMDAGVLIATQPDNNPNYVGGIGPTGLFVPFLADAAGAQQMAVDDGKDVAQGAKADAAWSGAPGAASLIAVCKAIWNAIVARQGTYVDRSVVATGASQTLMAANPARRSLVISNINALNAVGVNLAGGAAALGAAGTLTIKAGDSIRYESFPPSNAVTVIGTAADIVTAYEG